MGTKKTQESREPDPLTEEELKWSTSSDEEGFLWQAGGSDKSMKFTTSAEEESVPDEWIAPQQSPMPKDLQEGMQLSESIQDYHEPDQEE